MARISVLGGALAGLAAAARLAKVGHEVTLATGRPGGRWAAAEQDGISVDPFPGVLGFPAPWRDLFKKSGRAFDAELTRAGLGLVPGPPATHRFGDGTVLELPSERGAQFAAITAALGPGAAGQWRDLVDRMDDVWLALRPLGLEAELTGPEQVRGMRQVLLPRQSVEAVARCLGEPHLAALVRPVAHRLGSEPRRTPAWVLARLSLERTFGRWILTADGVPERTGRLLDLLIERLDTRKVTVTVDAPRHADATVDARRPAGRHLRPALAPTITHQVSPETTDHVREIVQHTAAGPIVTYHRPLPDGRTLRSVHDHTRPIPDPDYGVAWRGWRTITRLPPIRTEDPTRFTASPASPAGGEPWAQLLSAALATYACHEQLTGADIRPTNKALGRRRV